MRGLTCFNRWIEKAGGDGAPARPLEFLEKQRDRLVWNKEKS